jgi:hypothetical protein
MKQLAIVSVAAAAIITSFILHKYGIGLIAGVGVGSVYFLKSVLSGNGIGQVRLSQNPGEAKRPIDPGASIGMGLAASGIASGAIQSPDFSAQLGLYLPIVIILGIIIAVGYAIYGLKMQIDSNHSNNDELKNPGNNQNGTNSH